MPKNICLSLWDNIYIYFSLKVHFEFSRNEAERSEQLKILDGLREESIQNQKAAQEVKKRKQAILQQRLNRIRERKVLCFKLRSCKR